MVFVSIGLIVGIVMGLTGAGGALISIPLFLALLNASLKEATILSLTAVILSTFMNLIGQKNKPELKIVAPFVIFGAIGNYASLPLKRELSDLIIASLLLIIGLYSLWSIWSNKKEVKKRTGDNHLLKSSVIGLILGVITNLTGLGGGVLLIPILVNFYNKTYLEAIPTSLLTILSISSISFFSQIDGALTVLKLSDIFFIGLGSAGSFLVLKWALNKIEKNKIESIRKIVFTAVTFYSVTTVFLKSLGFSLWI